MLDDSFLLFLRQLISGCSLFTRELKLPMPMDNFNINALWRKKMRLSPPKQVTWFIALALAVLALLGFTGTISALSPYSFWLALIAAALLLIATIVKGL